MRIMMVITDLAVGGAEYQVLRLCQELKNRGNEICFVSMIPPTDERMEKFLLNKGIQSFNLGMKRGKISVSAVFKFLKLYHCFRPQVIHTHMIHPNLLVRFLSPFLRKVKRINTVHGEEEFIGKRKIIYRFTDSLADYTVCCGKALYEEAKYKRLISPKRLRYICNGLNVSEYFFSNENRIKYRKEFNITDEFVWISVGRLSEVKNQQYLIKEFKKIKEMFSSTVLILVGEGNEKSNLVEQIKNLNIAENVILAGQRNDVSKLLSAADAFVLSSKHEGLPLSLQEAAATCLPLVSTDVGGCNEVIKDGYNGYLCESNKADALANCMIRILNLGKEELHEMGIKSRELVENEFSISIISQKWIELYSI